MDGLKNLAERMGIILHSDKQKAIRVRRCLCCNGFFQSEWIGNRTCTPCKTRIRVLNITELREAELKFDTI